MERRRRRLINSTNLPSGWQQITLNVVGTGSDVLAFQGTGPEDELGALIDNVSLNAVTILDDEDTTLNGVGVQGGPGDDGHGVVATGQIQFDAGADGLKSIEATASTACRRSMSTPTASDTRNPSPRRGRPDGSGGGTLIGTSTLPWRKYVSR